MVMNGGRVWAWGSCERPGNIEMAPGLSPVCNASTNPPSAASSPRSRSTPPIPRSATSPTGSPRGGAGVVRAAGVPACTADNDDAAARRLLRRRRVLRPRLNALRQRHAEPGRLLPQLPRRQGRMATRHERRRPACDASGQGVQIVFADSAHIKLSGTLTIPCGRSATDQRSADRSVRPEDRHRRERSVHDDAATVSAADADAAWSSPRPATAWSGPTPWSTRPTPAATGWCCCPTTPTPRRPGCGRRWSSLDGHDVAVVITDTLGRPWRLGQTDVAVGLAGMGALDDWRGRADGDGRPLEVTEVAVADVSPPPPTWSRARRRGSRGRPCCAGSPAPRATAAPATWSARPPTTCSGPPARPRTCWRSSRAGRPQPRSGSDPVEDATLQRASAAAGAVPLPGGRRFQAVPVPAAARAACLAALLAGCGQRSAPSARAGYAPPPGAEPGAGSLPAAPTLLARRVGPPDPAGPAAVVGVELAAGGLRGPSCSPSTPWGSPPGSTRSTRPPGRPWRRRWASARLAAARPPGRRVSRLARPALPVGAR